MWKRFVNWLLEPSTEIQKLIKLSREVTKLPLNVDNAVMLNNETIEWPQYNVTASICSDHFNRVWMTKLNNGELEVETLATVRR